MSTVVLFSRMKFFLLKSPPFKVSGASRFQNCSESQMEFFCHERDVLFLRLFFLCFLSSAFCISTARAALTTPRKVLSVHHCICAAPIPWKHDSWQLAQFWATFVFGKRVDIFSPEFLFFTPSNWTFAFFSGCFMPFWVLFRCWSNLFLTPKTMPPSTVHQIITSACIARRDIMLQLILVFRRFHLGPSSLHIRFQHSEDLKHWSCIDSIRHSAKSHNDQCDAWQVLCFCFVLFWEKLLFEKGVLCCSFLLTRNLESDKIKNWRSNSTSLHARWK